MKSEAAVQADIRLAAPDAGVTLWRNNVGVLLDINGRPVRFGLANDSRALNEVLKSGDLIGWRPVLITSAMVGRTIAQFVSRECKPEGWRYSGSAHERAQAHWRDEINAAGGDAGFATGVHCLINMGRL